MNKVECARDRFSVNFGYRPGVDCDEEETRVAYNVFQLKCSDNYTPDQMLNFANSLVESKIKQGSLSDLSQRGLVGVVDFALMIGDDLYKTVQTHGGRDKAMEFLKNLVRLGQHNILAQCLLRESEVGEGKCVGWCLYRSEKKDDIMSLLDNLPKDIGERIKSTTWTHDYVKGGDQWITEQIFGNGSSMPL